MHWITKYMDKGWECGSKGPDAFDCYGFVQCVYENEYGIVLPDAPFLPEQRDEASISEAIQQGFQIDPDSWDEIEYPEDGCGVLLSFNGEIYHHIGLYLECDGGMVFHIPEDGSVMGEKLRVVKRRFKGVKFYRYGNFRSHS